MEERYMENSFYSPDELQEIGFKSIGENVLISRKASIYGAQDMIIGNNGRIDDFCLLSGKIELGNYIHISAYCAIWGGKAGVRMDDLSGLASRSAVYAKSDDYSGEHMTNPMVDEDFLGVEEKPVEICRHVLIGSGSTVLPGVTIGTGTVVGSMSLVNKSLEPWGIYVGVPCKYIKARSQKLLDLETEFLKKI